MDTVKIGRHIAAKRKEKGLTQTQLGDKLGVTNKTVSRWENGNYMPDLSLLEPLSKELGISLNELLAGEEPAAEKIVEQMEKSLADTLHYSNQEMRKNKNRYLGMIVGLAALVVILFVLVNQIYFREIPSYYGDVSQWQEMFPDHSAYGLEISYSGKPVFRNRAAALGKAKDDYSAAVTAIKKEFHLFLPLSKYTYKTYIECANQFVTEDEALMKQTEELIKVLDVYKNSFEWKDMGYSGQEQLVEVVQTETVDLAEQQRQALVTTFVLIAIGMAFIIYGMCDIYKYRQMKKMVCETRGKITGLVKSHLFRNDIYGEVPGGVQIGWGVAQGEQYWGGMLKWRIPPWFPCVQYFVDGKEYRRIMGEGNLKDAWYIGQEVTVLYHEGNPLRSQIRGDESLMIKIKLDFAIAIIFIAVGIISVIFMA